MRSLPNMTVVVPGDTIAVAKLLPQVAEWKGPVYFRVNRNEVPVIFDDSYQPVIGKAVHLRAGKDVTILCCGLMVSRSLEAAQVYNEGIQAGVTRLPCRWTSRRLSRPHGKRAPGYRGRTQHPGRAGEQ
jgi:transketolase